MLDWIIVMGFISFHLLGIILFVAGLVYLIREFFVKSPRRRDWVEKHNGELVGGDEFFAWCKEHHVDPKYYF